MAENKKTSEQIRQEENDDSDRRAGGLLRLFIPMAAGIIAVAILLIVGISNYTLLFNLSDDGFAIPQGLVLNSMNAEGRESTSLYGFKNGEGVYQQGDIKGKFFVGTDKAVVNTNYPLYTRSGEVLYFIDDRTSIITNEWDTLQSYEGLRLSDGQTFNADNTQADLQEIILVNVENGFQIAQMSKLESSLTSRSIAMNTICNFSENRIVCYEYNNGNLDSYVLNVYADSLFTIGDNVYKYSDFLRYIDAWQQGKKPGDLADIEAEIDRSDATQGSEGTLSGEGINDDEEGNGGADSRTGQSSATDLPQKKTSDKIPALPPEPEYVEPEPAKTTTAVGAAGEAAAPPAPRNPDYKDPVVTVNGVNPWVYNFQMPVTIIDDAGVINKNGVQFFAYLLNDAVETTTETGTAITGTPARTHAARAATIDSETPLILGQVRPNTYYNLTCTYTYTDENGESQTVLMDLGNYKSLDYDALNPIVMNMDTSSADLEVFPNNFQIRGLVYQGIYNGASALPGASAVNEATFSSSRAESFISAIYVDYVLGNVAAVDGDFPAGTAYNSALLEGTAINLLKRGFMMEYWNTKLELEPGSVYTYRIRLVDKYSHIFTYTGSASGLHTAITSKRAPMVNLVAPAELNQVSSTVLQTTWVNTSDCDITGTPAMFIVGQDMECNPSNAITFSAYRLNPDGTDGEFYENVTSVPIDISTDGAITEYRVVSLTSYSIYSCGVFCEGYNMLDGNDHSDLVLDVPLTFITASLTNFGTIPYLGYANKITHNSADLYLRYSYNSAEKLYSNKLLPLITHMKLAVKGADTTQTITLDKALLSAVVPDFTSSPGITSVTLPVYVNDSEETVDLVFTLTYSGDMPQYPLADGTTRDPANVWEFILATSTTNSNAYFGLRLSQRYAVMNGDETVMVPLMEMQKATEYKATLEIYASSGDDYYENITSSSSKGVTFSTTKVEPMADFADVFISDSFIELYNLGFTDPDSVISATKAGAKGNVYIQVKDASGIVVFKEYVESGNEYDVYRISGLEDNQDYILEIYAAEYKNVGNPKNNYALGMSLFTEDPADPERIYPFHTEKKIIGDLSLESLSRSYIDGEEEVDHLGLIRPEEWTEDEEFENTYLSTVVAVEAGSKYSIYSKLESLQISSTLPSFFEQVDYIQTNGKQYINLGYMHNEKTSISMEVLPMQSGTVANRTTIFGSRTGYGLSDVFDIGFSTVASENKYVINTGFTGEESHLIDDAAAAVNYSEFTTLEVEGSNASFNNYVVEISTAGAFGNAVLPDYLFAVNENGVASEMSMVKLKSLTIYEDGAIVMNLIPCTAVETVPSYMVSTGKKMPSNTVGLYDTIGKKFYVNEGTGLFGYSQSSGAEVYDIPTYLKQVAYIEATGLQYIKLDYKHQRTTTVEFSYLPKKGQNTWNVIFGSRTGTAQFDTFNVGFADDEGHNSYFVNTTSSNLDKLLLNVDYDQYSTVKISEESGLIVNGVAAPLTGHVGYMNSYNDYVFALNQKNTAYHFAKCQLRYMKVSDKADGNPRDVYNFVPCVATSEVPADKVNRGIAAPIGTVGLYDTLSGKFYISETTYNFEYAGSDVKDEYGSPVMLPDGLMMVSFLQSTGVEYIDTGYRPRNTTRAVYDFELNGNPTWVKVLGTFGNTAGTNNANRTSFFSMERNNNTNQFNLYYGNINKTVVKGNIEKITGRHYFDLNQRTWKLDNNTYTMGNYTFTSTYNFFLFGTSNYNNTCSGSAQKVYRAKLYDYSIIDNPTTTDCNEALIRDYIPCVTTRNIELHTSYKGNGIGENPYEPAGAAAANIGYVTETVPAGTAGMYDLVNGVFYKNSGSGAFTYNEISETLSQEETYKGTYHISLLKKNEMEYEVPTEFDYTDPDNPTVIATEMAIDVSYSILKEFSGELIGNGNLFVIPEDYGTEDLYLQIKMSNVPSSFYIGDVCLEKFDETKLRESNLLSGLSMENNSLLYNYSYDLQGNRIAAEGYAVTADYVKIQPDSVYYIEGLSGYQRGKYDYAVTDGLSFADAVSQYRSSSHTITFYNQNKQFVAALDVGAQSALFRTPSNAAYAKLTLQAEKETIDDAETDYYSQLQLGVPYEIDSQGKKLTRSRSDVWITFVPSVSGEYTFYSQNATQGDPFIYIYQSDKSTLVASDDDSYGAHNFKVRVYLEANTRYYVNATNSNTLVPLPMAYTLYVTENEYTYHTENAKLYLYQPCVEGNFTARFKGLVQQVEEGILENGIVQVQLFKTNDKVSMSENLDAIPEEGWSYYNTVYYYPNPNPAPGETTDAAIGTGDIEIPLFDVKNIAADYGYKAKLFVTRAGRTAEILIDEVEFTAVQSVYVIKDIPTLRRVANDPSGYYICVADIDNIDFTACDKIFTGVIDFQGHNLGLTSSNYLFRELGEDAIIKNAVFDYQRTSEVADSVIEFLDDPDHGTPASSKKFIKVDYVESTGSQMMLTEVASSPQLSYEVRFRRTGNETQLQDIIGAGGTGDCNIIRLNSDGSSALIRVANNRTFYLYNLHPENITTYSVMKNTFIIDDGESHIVQINRDNFSSTALMALFAKNGGANKATGRMYSVKMWKDGVDIDGVITNDVLVFDGVPVVASAEIEEAYIGTTNGLTKLTAPKGTAGIYDMVTGHFYYSLVPLKAPALPYSDDIAFAKEWLSLTTSSYVPTNSLPAEYQEVEYIESTGEQYINTQINGKNGFVTDMKFMLTDLDNTYHQLIGGHNQDQKSTSNNGSKGWHHNFLRINTKKLYLGFAEGDRGGAAVTPNQVYRVQASNMDGNAYLTIDGTSYYTSASNATQLDAPLGLFCGIYPKGDAFQFTKMRLYYCKIWTNPAADDASLVRDYVPCYRISDKKPGLYDKVSGTFFPSDGANDFYFPDSTVAYSQNNANLGNYVAPVAYNNYGRICDFVVKYAAVGESAYSVGDHTAGVAVNNYGTIDNFAVRFMKDIYVSSDSAGVVYNNNGTISNGYISGEKVSDNAGSHYAGFVHKFNSIATITAGRTGASASDLNFSYTYSGANTQSGYISYIASNNLQRGVIENVYAVNDLMVQSADASTMQQDNTLPEDFKRIEYLASTAGQYIDTQVPNNKGFKADLTIEPTALTGTYHVIIGGHTSGSPYYHNYLRVKSKLYWDLGFNSAEHVTQDNDHKVYVGNKYRLRVSTLDYAAYLYVNGNLMYSYNTEANQEPNGSLYMFAGCISSAPNYYTAMKLYSCTIYNPENPTEIIRNFVPCVYEPDDTSATITANKSQVSGVSYGTAGLYDLVEGVFYVDPQKRAFTSGPYITVAPDPDAPILENEAYSGILAGYNEGKIENSFAVGDFVDVKYMADSNGLKISERVVMSSPLSAPTNVSSDTVTSYPTVGVNTSVHTTSNVSYVTLLNQNYSYSNASANSKSELKSLYDPLWYQSRLGADEVNFRIYSGMSDGEFPKPRLSASFSQEQLAALSTALPTGFESLRIVGSDIRLEGNDPATMQQSALVTLLLANPGTIKTKLSDVTIIDSLGTRLDTEIIDQGASGSTYRVDVLITFRQHEKNTTGMDPRAESTYTVAAYDTVLDSVVQEGLSFASTSGENIIPLRFYHEINNVADWTSYLGGVDKSEITENYMLAYDINFESSQSYRDWLVYANFKGVLDGGKYEQTSENITNYLGDVVYDNVGLPRTLLARGEMTGMHTISGVGNTGISGEYLATRGMGSLDSRDYNFSNINAARGGLFCTVSGELNNIIFDRFNTVYSEMYPDSFNDITSAVGGVIAVAKSGARITNCHVRNSSINTRGYGGALAAYASNVLITNCSARNVSIKGNNAEECLDRTYLGGLVGYATNTNIQASFTADMHIDGTDVSTLVGAGGIAGVVEYTDIYGCYCSGGLVNALQNCVGGIVGKVGDYADVTSNSFEYNTAIESCWTSITVETSKDFAGGIAGYMGLYAGTDAKLGSNRILNNYTASTVISMYYSATHVNRINCFDFENQNSYYNNYAFVNQSINYKKNGALTSLGAYQFGPLAEYNGASRLLSADDISQSSTWKGEIGLDDTIFDVSKVESDGIMPLIFNLENGGLLYDQPSDMLGSANYARLEFLSVENQGAATERLETEMILFNTGWSAEDLSAFADTLTEEKWSDIADWEAMEASGGRVNLAGNTDHIVPLGIVEEEGEIGLKFRTQIYYGDPELGHYADSYLVSVPVYLNTPDMSPRLLTVAYALVVMDEETMPVKEIPTEMEWNEFFKESGSHYNTPENIRLTGRNEGIYEFGSNSAYNANLQRVFVSGTHDIVFRTGDNGIRYDDPEKLFISNVAESLSGVNFEHFYVDYDGAAPATENNIGIIGKLAGSLSDVSFNDVEIRNARTQNYAIGLIGEVTEGAYVEGIDIDLVKINAEGNSIVGGLAGIVNATAEHPAMFNDINVTDIVVGDTADPSTDADYIGSLFGKIYNGQTNGIYIIENTGVENPPIGSGARVTGHSYIGGVAGYAEDTVLGGLLIRSVEVDSTGTYTGGIVGYAKNSKIDGLEINGISVIADGNDVGGVFGYTENSGIADATLITNIDVQTQGDNAGGLAGTSDGGNYSQMHGYARSLLPAGYKQVEYIESDRSLSQYLDTEVVPTSTMKFVADAQIMLASTDQQCIFGAGNGSNSYWQVAYLGQGSYYRVQCGKGGTERDQYPKDIERHTFVLNGTNRMATIDNFSITLPSTANAAYNLTLFAYHGAAAPTSFSTTRMYSFKGYNYGDMIVNMIPAVRESDGAVGMFDTVRNKFYVNSGQGNFKAGPECGMDDSTVLDRGTYSLPSSLDGEYIPLEYIEGTRTQYINTGWYPQNQQVDILMDMAYAEVPYDYWVCPLGTRLNNNGVIEIELATNQTNDAKYGRFRYGGYYGGTANTDGTYYNISTGMDTANVRYIFEKSGCDVIVNGNVVGQVQNDKITTNANNPFTLFAMSDNNTIANYKTAVRFYHATISASVVKQDVEVQADGSEIPVGEPYEVMETIRDMFPVKRVEDGELGMYDTITGMFYPNAGTGKFTAGPELITENGATGYESIGKEPLYEEVTEHYRELEYIESSGTQYIYTGLYADEAQRIDLHVMRINDTQAFGAIAGSGIYNWQYTGLSLNLSNSGTSYFYYGHYNSFTYTFNPNTKYFIEIWRHNARNLAITPEGGERRYIGGGSKNGAEPSLPVTLFCVVSAREGMRRGYCRMYDCQIYNDVDATDGHGIDMLRDFVPVQRISDGELGLYDKIEGKFYPNTGTGEFIAGPVKEETTAYTTITQPDIYKDLADDEFIQIPYITGTGKQYIDTGYVPDGDTKVEMTLRSFNYEQTFFGVRAAGGAGKEYSVIRAGDGFPYSRYGTSNSGHNRNTGTILNDTKFRIIKDRGTCICVRDGANETLNNINNGYQTFSVDGYTLVLMGMNDGGTVNCSRMSIYECQIYQYPPGNGPTGAQLVRDFIAVRRLKDNELGLFDRVEKKFYRNAGTGSFAAPQANLITPESLPRLAMVSNITVNARNNVGGMIGYAAPGSNVRFNDTSFRNIAVNVISGGTAAGGIVGNKDCDTDTYFDEIYVDKCIIDNIDVVKGDTPSNETEYSNFGGLVGESDCQVATFKDVIVNDLYVESGTNGGGAIGYYDPIAAVSEWFRFAKADISNVLVDVIGSNAGGIAGNVYRGNLYLDDTDLDTVVVAATQANAGGVVGYASHDAADMTYYIGLSKRTNDLDLSMDNITVENNSGKAGGFIGYAQSGLGLHQWLQTASMIKGTNITVQSQGADVGGLIGRVDAAGTTAFGGDLARVRLSNIVLYGGNERVGGISGGFYHRKPVTECYVQDALIYSGLSQAGGLFGDFASGDSYINKAGATNVVVMAADDRVGGVAGAFAGSKISFAYTTGVSTREYSVLNRSEANQYSLSPYYTDRLSSTHKSTVNAMFADYIPEMKSTAEYDTLYTNVYESAVLGKAVTNSAGFDGNALGGIVGAVKRPNAADAFTMDDCFVGSKVFLGHYSANSAADSMSLATGGLAGSLSTQTGTFKMYNNIADGVIDVFGEDNSSMATGGIAGYYYATGTIHPKGANFYNMLVGSRLIRATRGSIGGAAGFGLEVGIGCININGSMHQIDFTSLAPASEADGISRLRVADFTSLRNSAGGVSVQGAYSIGEGYTYAEASTLTTNSDRLLFVTNDELVQSFYTGTAESGGMAFAATDWNNYWKPLLMGQSVQGSLELPYIIRPYASVKTNTLSLAEIVKDDLIAYASGIDTINIELPSGAPSGLKYFLKKDDITLSGVWPEGQKALTFAYDFADDINLTLEYAGANAVKTIAVSDLASTVMTYDNTYWYAYRNNVLDENNKAVNGDKLFVHMYAGMFLDSEGDVYDAYTLEKVAHATSFAKAQTTPLWSGNVAVDGNVYNINTFASYSTSEGKNVDARLYAKGGKLYTLSASKLIISGPVLDSYNSNMYASVVLEDGTMKDLGAAMACPDGFVKSGIAQISSNIDYDGHVVLVRYQSGALKAFNYMTGEKVEVLSYEPLLVSLGEFFKNSLSKLSLSGPSSGGENGLLMDVAEYEQMLKSDRVYASALNDLNASLEIGDALVEGDAHDTDGVLTQGEGVVFEEVTEGINENSDAEQGADKTEGTEGIEENAQQSQPGGEDEQNEAPQDKKDQTTSGRRIEGQTVTVGSDGQLVAQTITTGSTKTRKYIVDNAYVALYNDETKGAEIYETEELLSKNADARISEKAKSERLSALGVKSSGLVAQNTQARAQANGLIFILLFVAALLALVSIMFYIRRRSFNESEDDGQQ